MGKIEEAFLEVIKNYPNLIVRSAWRKKVLDGTMKHSTMRKHLEKAGWIKVSDEIWTKP